MGFNLEDCVEWVNDYRKIWKAAEEHLFVTFTSKPVKEGCYLNGKLNVWKDKIRTDFHGKDIPYNQCCKATAVLKVKSVYKQGSNCYPQVYVEEAEIKSGENSKCRLLNDFEDDYKRL